MEAKQLKNTLLILGIIFVAFNLRPAITAVGPLVSFIREDMGISNGLAGLLTTLPLLSFALISPFTPRMANKFGTEGSIFIGLCLLGAGILIRSTGFIAPLYIGTIFIGFGIAICNVLLPGMVKRSFPGKIGLLTGSYTFSMAVFAGLAPGFSIPLAETFQTRWQMSLAIWVILLLSAILIWLPQLKVKKSKPALAITKTSMTSLWTSPIAWQVTLFMGLQSMIYFSLTAWLPEILNSQGMDIATAGWMVTLMQFSGLPANFLIPVLADRLPHQKGIALGIGLFCFLGLAGLFIGGNSLFLTISIILIGIALGAAISHALTLITLRAADSHQAADLSGMAQSVGYFLASMGPFILGYLFDIFSTWMIPLILLIVVSVLFTIAGFGAGRNQFVLQKNTESISHVR
ncbi:MFS transporter [Mesobacillus maritimus]|uniref:CynX/NimT family MFS transporter n=1 Tax=Mesobacillus maritimus TaxID=1643336 RepID=UPI00203A86B5|nr:MFS transporter [Mesobacillus maritimus]MCM3587997.1 MFS transporter [Mesobacillus maritimus]